MATADGPSTPRIADLHCHYPMHLPSAADEAPAPPVNRALHELTRSPKEAAPHATGQTRRRPRWVDRLRLALLRWAAKVLSDETPESGWRVDFDRVRSGGVRLVFSVLYQPFAEIDIGRWPEGRPESGYAADVCAQLETVNEDLRTQHGGAEHVVVRRVADLDPEVLGDRTAFVHCIEGGFHLGADPDQVSENVKALADAGVVYVTLAHLFFRQVAKNTPALPFLPDWVYNAIFWQWGPALTDLGRAAVEAMYEHRVLIDISHMREDAIDEVFGIIEDLDRARGNRPEDYPVIATHGAVRLHGQQYNLTRPTIERIAKRGGVVGLILAKHQLVEKPKRPYPENLDQSVEVLMRHIDAIVEYTKGYENVGIGSDLDGFIRPTLTGLQDIDNLALLHDRLERAYPGHAAAILHDNALRIARTAFRGRPEPSEGPGS